MYSRTLLKINVANNYIEGRVTVRRLKSQRWYGDDGRVKL